MTHQAKCQCGSLAVESTVAPDFVVACSCKACQRRTGAAFGVGAYFKKSGLKISGAHDEWARKADTGREIVNHFCPKCGTTVFWSLEMRPEYMGVAVGCMTTPVPQPVRAIWTSQKLEWVTFPDDLPTFEGPSPS